MNDSTASIAIDLLKKGEVKNAKEILEISDAEMSDEKFIRQLTSLSTALELSANDKIIDSVPHFQSSNDLVEICNDQEIKILVPILLQYGQGITYLHSGDTYGAYQLFQYVTTSLNQLAFYDATFKKFALSTQAGAAIAIARTNLNIGNLEEAQKWMANAESTYDELLKLLDTDNPEDYGAFVEAFGLPVEVSIVWASIDLHALDVESSMNRLKSVNSKLKNLKLYTDKLTDGSTKNVSTSVIIIYENLYNLIEVVNDLFEENKELSKENLQTIKNVIYNLTNAKEIALKAGERGHGTASLINQLIRYSKNLISTNSVGKKEINKFAGLIAFLSFIIILLLVNYVFQPEQVLGLGYFFGSLLLSLIIGYGFGALKFMPLINTYKETLKDLKN